MIIMKKNKVALIHNIIAPYRIPLFEGLANHPSIDFYAYFCSKTHKERKWDISENNKFKYQILTGIAIELSPFIYQINPSIVRELIKEKYDAVIIGGYTDFTTQTAFFLSKLMKKPILLYSEGTKPLKPIWKIINPFEKYIIRNTDAIIVPGRCSKNFHIKMGAKKEKIFMNWLLNIPKIREAEVKGVI